jgi:hypothetical protein
MVTVYIFIYNQDIPLSVFANSETELAVVMDNLCSSSSFIIIPTCRRCLRVFENRVLRRIFEPNRDEVTGGWRKLHNEELHGLYSSPRIVRVIKARMMRWAGHVARIGKVRGAYNILVGRPEGRRPLGRPRRRWDDNIKMDLREIGLGDVDWIRWDQDRDRWVALVNTVMNSGFHKMRGFS